MDLLHTLFFFILALVVLIAVHEWGHFWMARRLGVKVIRFSLGFGPTLWRYQQAPETTEFVISAFPLGGYVKMVDEREGDVALHDLPYAYNRQPLRSRIAIVAAGPLSNFLLSILLFWILLVVGETGLRPVLGPVDPGSIAAEASLVAGDEIISVAGQKTPTWSQALSQIYGHILDDNGISVEVSGESGQHLTHQLQIPEEIAQSPDLLHQRLGLHGAEPDLEPVIEKVEPGGAAAAAGMQAGDRIVRVNNIAITSWQSWVNQVRQNPSQMLHVRVLRDGVTLDVLLTPTPVAGVNGVQQGKVGASVQVPETMIHSMEVRYSMAPLPALVVALERTYDYSWMTLRMMGRMLTGRAAIENLSGPISIAQYAGRSARLGMDQFVNFLALISISLGVLNLLPVPLLDGGHLMFYMIEAICRRPVPDSIQFWFQKVGMAILLALMALAFFLDIERLFH